MSETMAEPTEEQTRSTFMTLLEGAEIERKNEAIAAAKRPERVARALERIADAQERIATALEAQAKASDFLNAALLPEQPMGDVPSVPEWRVDRDGGFIVLDGGGGRGEYAEAAWRPATDAEAEAIRARIRPSERRGR